jgi:uncharacterized protein
MKNKLNNLRKNIEDMGSLAVAFSGGVDSTFLLEVAHHVLGDKVMAITLSSELYPDRELQETIKFCKEKGITHKILKVDELGIDGFTQNPPDRCYLCKTELFQNVIDTAAEAGIHNVAEGSNMDDTGDYRPGMRAIAELHVKSPLKDAGLYKEEIRELSKEMGLPTWDKPSYACLASRFVYGQTITKEKLRMVGGGEQFLMDNGFKQVRVRIHEDVARIELAPKDISRAMEPEMRDKICQYMKKLGFKYVTMDLIGYRTGSMNEVL